MKHKTIKLSRRQIKKAKARAYEDMINELERRKDKIRRLEQANLLLHKAIDSAQERANKAEAKVKQLERVNKRKMTIEILKGE